MTAGERTQLYNLGYGLEHPFTAPPATGTITLTSPYAYQVFQRDEDNRSDISISGTYTGTPAAIEASWNGGIYSTIAASPTGGTFSGILENQVGGQGTLLVRFTDSTVVLASRNYVGVGDIYVVAGQSNVSGRGTNNQSYTNPTYRASLFGNNDVWKNLVDPTDSFAGQIDNVSDDGAAAGSVWPLLATYILADQSVPVAFVPTAKGSTTILQWQKSSGSGVTNGTTTPYSSCSSSLDASGLYGSLSRRIGVVGAVKAVLFFQGETDAVIAQEQTSYQNYLNCFINNIYADFTVPVVSGIIADVVTTTNANVDAVRMGARQVLATNSHAVAGPVMVDVNIADEGGDGIHFKTDTELALFAERWWASLKSLFYDGSDDGHGPRLTSAIYAQDKMSITLTFNDTSGLADTVIDSSVFTVKDNGTPVIVLAVERLSSTQLRLALEVPLVGSPTVSLASGTTGYAGAMPTDNSEFALPAEPFVDVAVTLEVTTPDPAPEAPRTRVIGGSYMSSTSPYVVAPVSTDTTSCRSGDLFSATTGARCLSSTAPSTPSTPKPVFTRSLSHGMTGEDVRTLQQYLNTKGFVVSVNGAGSVGNETNYFGPATRAAVIKFQVANNIIPAVGFFGPVTRTFINK